MPEGRRARPAGTRIQVELGIRADSRSGLGGRRNGTAFTRAANCAAGSAKHSSVPRAVGSRRVPFRAWRSTPGARGRGPVPDVVARVQRCRCTHGSPLPQWHRVVHMGELFPGSANWKQPYGSTARTARSPSRALRAGRQGIGARLARDGALGVRSTRRGTGHRQGRTGIHPRRAPAVPACACAWRAWASCGSSAATRRGRIRRSRPHCALRRTALSSIFTPWSRRFTARTLRIRAGRRKASRDAGERGGLRNVGSELLFTLIFTNLASAHLAVAQDR